SRFLETGDRPLPWINPTIMTEDVSQTQDIPLPQVSERLSINEFRERPLGELHVMAEALPIRIPGNVTKSQLVFEMLNYMAREGAVIEGEGVIEQAKENYAMLRDPKRSFRTSPDDLY